MSTLCKYTEDVTIDEEINQLTDEIAFLQSELIKKIESLKLKQVIYYPDYFLK